MSTQEQRPDLPSRTIDDVMRGVRNYAIATGTSPARLEALFNVGLAAVSLLNASSPEDPTKTVSPS